MGFSAWLLLRTAHRARRNRLHKLTVFQAGFGSPVKDEISYLENLNSCVLQVQKVGSAQLSTIVHLITQDKGPPSLPGKRRLRQWI